MKPPLFYFGTQDQGPAPRTPQAPRMWPNRLGWDVDGHEVWIYSDGLGVRTWDDGQGCFTRTAWIPDATVSPRAAAEACLERGALIVDLPVWDASPLQVRAMITLHGVQEILQ